MSGDRCFYVIHSTLCIELDMSAPNPLRHAKRELPALTSLRAFEAVGVRKSFSLAARDLFVTQSAISHHIAKLEEALGAELIVRRARSIEFTAVGQAYFEKIHKALGLMRRATADVYAEPKLRPKLNIGVLASFATRWLAKRLHHFQAENGDIEVCLISDVNASDFSLGEVDISIRYGRGGWPDVDSKIILPERLTVVCSPEFKEKRTIGNVAQLAEQQILASYSAKQFEWKCWSLHFGFDYDSARKLNLYDYSTVIEAALSGFGVAMGRSHLIDDLLKSGRLVPALPDSFLEDPSIGWWLLRPCGIPNPLAERFASWLEDQASAS